MAAPKQPRPAAARPGGGKSRDRGTRGGRPEPPPAGTAGRGDAQRANGQQRGQASRTADRPPAGRGTAVPATPQVRAVPLWFQLTTWVLALAGLGVSVYLTVAHFTSPRILVCSEKGFVNCAAVTTSPESMVFGIFPVAVLGLAFFVFMAGVTSPWAWRASWPAIRWARFGSVLVGIVFVLYLIYTELFTLNAICLFCTIVHVITFLLFGLIMFGFAAGYGAPEAPARR
ncbi:MAG TPA: vitamin K epoxide reductase family protein [Streptosporangiaceae bacterium]|nr:vitamin K epoxide reductase family protein [Streptosporangiaceae bacterium]